MLWRTIEMLPKPWLVILKINSKASRDLTSRPSGKMPEVLSDNSYQRMDQDQEKVETTNQIHSPAKCSKDFRISTTQLLIISVEIKHWSSLPTNSKKLELAKMKWVTLWTKCRALKASKISKMLLRASMINLINKKEERAWTLEWCSNKSGVLLNNNMAII